MGKGRSRLRYSNRTKVLLCYLAAGLHLSGCVGDWYYVRTILRDRRIVACEDTSFGVRFFG